MKIDSLSEKLVLYFVLLGIGAIMCVSSVAFYSSREALISRTFDQLTSMRYVKKNQVERFYADRVTDLLLLSGSEEIHELIAGSTMKGKNDVRNPLSGKIASKYRTLGQNFSAFYILGSSGLKSKGCFSETAGNTPPVIPDQVFIQLRDELRGRPYIICDESLDVPAGLPYQLIAAPVPGPDEHSAGLQSILILSISIEAINAIMLNNDPLSGLGLSGETYLVGPDFLMRSTSRFQANSIQRTQVKTESVTEALAGKTGTVTTNDYRDIPVLSSYSMIGVQGLQWAILAEIDLQEAMIPIYEIRTRILLLSAIIVVIFFGFVLAISRRITKPLIRLKNATVNLGEGQYGLDLPVTTLDEIGSLTESFNVMARQIKEKTTELQKERFGRMRSVFDGEEMERQRLSRELHDGIGQSLIAVKLRLENLLYQEGSDVRNSIQELKKHLDQIIDEVRRISNNLIPSVLEVFSIPIAFRNLFSETEENSGLRIHFESKGDFEDLDRKIKTYIYRLTQEALNNIVKHADAREIRVSLTRESDQLILIIADDGIGFLPEKVGTEGGTGIHNMRERAGLLQGQIEINSIPSKGTTIKLTVPIITTYVKNQDFPRG